MKPRKLDPRILATLPAGEKARALGYRDLEDAFAMQLRGAGISGYVREWRFHPERRWRLDFGWPAELLAVEIHGGIHSGGRHVRGKGFAEDALKLATAAAMGIRVLPVTADMVRSGDGLRLIQEAIAWPERRYGHVVRALVDEGAATA